MSEPNIVTASEAVTMPQDLASIEEYSDCLKSYRSTLEYLVRHYQSFTKSTNERIALLESQNELLQAQNKELLHQVEEERDYSDHLKVYFSTEEKKLERSKEIIQSLWDRLR